MLTLDPSKFFPVRRNVEQLKINLEPLQRLTRLCALTFLMTFHQGASLVAAVQQAQQNRIDFVWNPSKPQEFLIPLGSNLFKLSIEPIYTDSVETVISLANNTFVYTKRSEDGDFWLYFLKVSQNSQGVLQLNVQKIELPPNAEISFQELLDGKDVVVASGFPWSGSGSGVTAVAVARETGVFCFQVPGRQSFSPIPGSNWGCFQPFYTAVDMALIGNPANTLITLWNLKTGISVPVTLPVSYVEALFPGQNGSLVALGYKGESDSYVSFQLALGNSSVQIEKAEELSADQAANLLEHLAESVSRGKQLNKLTVSIGVSGANARITALNVATEHNGHSSSPEKNSKKQQIQIRLTDSNPSHRQETTAVLSIQGDTNQQIIDLIKGSNSHAGDNQGFFIAVVSQQPGENGAADQNPATNNTAFSINQARLSPVSFLDQLQEALNKTFGKETSRLRNGDGSIDDVLIAVENTLAENSCEAVKKVQAQIYGGVAVLWQVRGGDGDIFIVSIYVTPGGGGRVSVNPNGSIGNNP